MSLWDGAVFLGVGANEAQDHVHQHRGHAALTRCAFLKPLRHNQQPSLDRRPRRLEEEKIRETDTMHSSSTNDSGLMPSPKKKRKTPANRRISLDRLEDLGVRMNSLRTEGELRAFLTKEVAAIFGTRRVLLVLETPGGPLIAGSVLPRSERPPALLQAITPWLDSARTNRSCSLRQGPEGAKPVAQRSCLLAPSPGGRRAFPPSPSGRGNEGEGNGGNEPGLSRIWECSIDAARAG